MLAAAGRDMQLHAVPCACLHAQVLETRLAWLMTTGESRQPCLLHRLQKCALSGRKLQGAAPTGLTVACQATHQGEHLYICCSVSNTPGDQNKPLTCASREIGVLGLHCQEPHGLNLGRVALVCRMTAQLAFQATSSPACVCCQCMSEMRIRYSTCSSLSHCRL